MAQECEKLLYALLLKGCILNQIKQQFTDNSCAKDKRNHNRGRGFIKIHVNLDAARALSDLKRLATASRFYI